MELVLAGGGEGGQRAAVEGLLCADHAVGAVELDLAPAAGELDRALVRLGAGVREEGLPGDGGGPGHVAGLVGDAREQRREPVGGLAAVLDIEVVAHLPELLGLLAHGGDHGGVAVAEGGAADAAEEVEVFVARRIGEHGAGALDELDGQAAVGAEDVGVVEGLGLSGDGGEIRHRGLFPNPG